MMEKSHDNNTLLLVLIAICMMSLLLDVTDAVSPYTYEAYKTRTPLTHQASIRSISCPPTCYCSSTTWNCDGAGLTETPEGVPETVLYITFNNNKIKTIPPDFLRDLPLLRTVDLRNNLIESLNYAAFSDMPQVETIYLANNRIKSIQYDTFTNLDQLQTLRLDNNSISTLIQGTFQDLPRLREIRLDNNPIHTIAPGAFRRLERLERIQMDNSLTNYTHLGTYDYGKATGSRTFAPECPKLNQIALGQMEIRALQPGSMGTLMTGDTILGRIRRVGKFQVYSSDLEECDLLSKFSITDKSYGVTMCIPKQAAQEADSPSRQEKAHLNQGGNGRRRLLTNDDDDTNDVVVVKKKKRKPLDWRKREKENKKREDEKMSSETNEIFGNPDLQKLTNSLTLTEMRRLESKLNYD